VRHVSYIADQQWECEVPRRHLVVYLPANGEIKNPFLRRS